MYASQISAGRTLDPEQVVIAWIEEESPAPLHLATVLAKYRGLVMYADLDTTTVAESDVAIAEADTLYDQLMAAAAVTLTISAKAEAQLRRIARKREAHLTLSQRMDLAVLRNPQADAWGAADWQSGAIYQPKAGVV